MFFVLYSLRVKPRSGLRVPLSLEHPVSQSPGFSVMSLSDEIKKSPYCKGDSQAPDMQDTDVKNAEVEDRYEVFKRGDGQVDFRTVSWIRASVIFLKSKRPVICDPEYIRSLTFMQSSLQLASFPSHP